MSKKSEVQVLNHESTAVALPADLLAELANDAKASASMERATISGISLRAGIISYNGEPVKGSKLRVVVVASSYINTLYFGKWDPDNITNPDCFALSETGDGMAPHADVTKPFHADCATCPNMQWGSDLRDGKPAKGKRCKESRRLILMPESALSSAEEVASAELAMVKLPVTSVAAWGNFVNALDAMFKLPHYAVVAEISTQPDVKTQFKVLITPVDRINDPAIIRAIMAKRVEAVRSAMVPYDPNVEAFKAETAAEKF